MLLRGVSFYVSLLAVGGTVCVSRSASPYNSQGAPFILGKASSLRLHTTPGTGVWCLSWHAQRWCIPAMGLRDASPPSPHCSFLEAEHPLPTLGATLGSRRCQRMESRATAATGEPANTFSYGMQRRRHLIPPSSPLPPSNIYQPPSPAAGAGRFGAFFPSIPF